MSKENINEDIKKLRDLIKDINYAMLTTVDDDGTLHSRPMVTQQVDFDGDLWFITDVETAKVKEVKHNNHVNVTFSEPKDFTFVSVSGIAEVVNNRKKIKDLWNPLYNTWFPNGSDDENITLLKINIRRAEYWDSPSSKMVSLFKYLTTGKIGEHKKVEVKY